MRKQLKTQIDHLRQIAGKVNTQLHDAIARNDFSEILQQTKQMNDLLDQMQSSLTFTLSDEEYLQFCDLIVCSSELAQHILTTQSSTRSAKRHAIYWQKIAKEFKPFLTEVIHYYATKKLFI